MDDSAYARTIDPMPSKSWIRPSTLAVFAALLALAGCASSSSISRSTARETRTASVRVDTPGHYVARLARNMVGVPYRYGGSDPASGFDCSGLVYYSYSEAGVSVPRSSQDLFSAVTKIALDDAEPGDLIFFQDQEKLSHVGIYLGNRTFVHAPSSGKHVSVASVDTPYYQRHLVAVGRL